MKNPISFKKRIVFALITSTIAITVMVVDGMNKNNPTVPLDKDEYGIQRAEDQNRILSNIEKK